MVFLAMVIGLYAFFFFLVPDLGDPAFKSHFSTIPMTARLHIIPGGIALVLGAFQFHPGLRGMRREGPQLASDSPAWQCSGFTLA